MRSYTRRVSNATYVLRGGAVCVCNEKRSELTLAIVVSFALELYELPEVSLYVD